MIVNLWMGFDDRAQSTAKTPTVDPETGDETPHPATRGLGELTVPQLFRIDDAPGPRNYQLWSLYFDVADDDEAVTTRNAVLAMFPGQVRTIGGWWVDDGRMVGTENVYSTRIVEKTWSVRNPDYDPNEFLEDGVTPNPDFDDRYVLRVTGDVEEEYVSGHTGDPLFPLHVRILEFVPDVVVYDENGDEVSRARPTELADVNLMLGQAPRNFI